MQPISKPGYTDQEILDALQGSSGVRELTFRYELLDHRNGVIKEVDNVLSASVEYNQLADIKRTAKFQMVDDGSIDFLRHRIRPWVRLKLGNEPRIVPVRPYGDSVTQMLPDFRWPLDEAAGADEASDVGPNNRPLINMGTVEPGESPLLSADDGHSAEFAGAVENDIYAGFNFAAHLNGLDSFSVAFWFNDPALAGTYGTIFGTSEGADWGIGLSLSATQFGVKFETSTGPVSYSVSSHGIVGGTTHFAVVTWTKGSAPKTYLDGVLKIMGTFTSAGINGILAKANTVYVGRGRDGRYSGKVDDVTVFRRALSQSEVSTLYAGGTQAGVPDQIVQPYIEWPQGVFLLTSPTRKANDTGTVIRDVDAYDQLLIYRDDVVTNRYAVEAGSVYTDAIEQLLGTSVEKNITRSSLTLPTTMEWEPGTPKLTVINALLHAINYESLLFDEYGVAVARPYVQPTDRASEYTYATDQRSVILPDAEQTLDLFDVPNSFTLVVSDPDRSPLTSTYVNDNPASVTSTVARGRTIVQYVTEQTAPDQARLDEAARNRAHDASQIYEQISFSTALMPIHSNADVYTLTYSELGISAKYAEQCWSMDLEAGTTMKHTCRRTVQLDPS